MNRDTLSGVPLGSSRCNASRFPGYAEYALTGDEFFNRIPHLWDLRRVGDIASVRGRLGWKGLKADEYVDDGYVFLSTPNIKPREIDWVNVNFISEARYEESPEIKLERDDVLLAKDGSTLGIANVVRELPRPATVNSSIAVIRPLSAIHGRYLRYVLESQPMRGRVQSMKGGMGVPHLFQADIRKMPVPVPSLVEQQKIALFLDAQTGLIETLSAKTPFTPQPSTAIRGDDVAADGTGVPIVQRLADALLEYRSALITAAVTGQIDVSEFAMEAS